MALTNCPACNKRISTKAPHCQHCGYVPQGQSSEELDKEWARVRQHKRDKANQWAMLSLLVTIAAFAYYALQQPAPESLPFNLAVGFMIAGFITYIIARARIALLGKKRR